MITQEWKRIHDTRAEAEAFLNEAAARLRRYTEQGDAACSSNDLRNGYNAHFNMNLAGNHIIAARRDIATWPAEMFAEPDPAEGIELHDHPNISVCGHSSHKQGDISK